MITRADRIAMAEERLRNLEDAVKQIESAKNDLRLAQESFDPGESVVWRDPACERGCCYEDYDAKIISIGGTHPGQCTIKLKNGTIKKDTWFFSIKRDKNDFR